MNDTITIRDNIKIKFDKDHYVVSYGLQEDNCFSYEEACRKIGENIMHQLCCEGHGDDTATNG